MNLDKALEFANYQSTLNRERQLLNQKFQDNCVLAYNGGLFKLTLELISALTHIDRFVLDMHNNPIRIENKEEFIKLAISQYESAIDQYGIEYEELRKKRSVKALVNL